VGGDLSTDMMIFCGLLGLGVSFNGGVARRVRANRSAPQPGETSSFNQMSPTPLPAFQRRLPKTSR
jgi:hypothetical protein